MPRISLLRVLEVVGEFDLSGGASLGLVAWELCVEEEQVLEAWKQAQADGLLKPAGEDPLDGEQLWRLTVPGWAALQAEQRDGA